MEWKSHCMTHPDKPPHNKHRSPNRFYVERTHFALLLRESIHSTGNARTDPIKLCRCVASSPINTYTLPVKMVGLKAQSITRLLTGSIRQGSTCLASTACGRLRIVRYMAGSLTQRCAAASRGLVSGRQVF
eukprot:scaffold82055_cov29-Prasinocladus_malaysianus.AAC.1